MDELTNVIDLPVPPTHPSSSTALRAALAACGVTRSGLVAQLADIAATGEKVTLKEKSVRGVMQLMERTVVRDPSLQIKAIDKLTDLLDRADGLVMTERATIERKTFG